MLIMLLLHLILHPAQPAALTAVAMETSGAQEEALDGKRRRDAGWVAKRGEEQEIEKRRVVMKGHADWGRWEAVRGTSWELERGEEEAYVLSEQLMKGEGEDGTQ